MGWHVFPICRPSPLCLVDFPVVATPPKFLRHHRSQHHLSLPLLLLFIYVLLLVVWDKNRSIYKSWNVRENISVKITIFVSTFVQKWKERKKEKSLEMVVYLLLSLMEFSQEWVCVEFLYDYIMQNHGNVIINVFWHKSIETLNYKQPVRRTEININVYNIYLCIFLWIFIHFSDEQILCIIL